ncbi:uncharacterized protein LOC131294277 [Anopheles ziemanni]|uniref:uncharacterized protein LOC131264969 n=1 Tax=Anopheles coustani TaxID=139045 RepID=UPI0026583CEF|nr:uncharacterized protein LOC131264969 [Anopheles coustani]XP_058178306.1 uncharacterized protein LOC131294277 [Anopheles ziemanni]
MTPSRMLLVIALGFTVGVEAVLPKNDTTPGECTMVGALNPRECCRSFTELHDAIIACMPKPDRAGTTCIAQCILQGYSLRPWASSVPLSLSRIITYGPKLAAHFDECKTDLMDFLQGNMFQGDFQRVVCDERVNRFFVCMVKSWFQDCLGFDDTSEKCNEMKEKTQSGSCNISTFFGISRVD